MIRDQLFHIPVVNYVKEVFRENTQNINIRTDMAHLVNLKISLSFLATLVITFLSCIFIIIMQYGIIQLQDMERGICMILKAP